MTEAHRARVMPVAPMTLTICQCVRSVPFYVYGVRSRYVWHSLTDTHMPHAMLYDI